MKHFGIVIWFQDKFGFLSWHKNGQKQLDLFVHYSDIKMKGFKKLEKGQKVSFSLGDNHHSQPKAVEVELCE